MCSFFDITAVAKKYWSTLDKTYQSKIYNTHSFTPRNTSSWNRGRAFLKQDSSKSLLESQVQTHVLSFAGAKANGSPADHLKLIRRNARLCRGSCGPIVKPTSTEGRERLRSLSLSQKSARCYDRFDNVERNCHSDFRQRQPPRLRRARKSRGSQKFSRSKTETGYFSRMHNPH